MEVIAMRVFRLYKNDHASKDVQCDKVEVVRKDAVKIIGGKYDGITIKDVVAYKDLGEVKHEG